MRPCRDLRAVTVNVVDSRREVVIFGASGHGKVIIDIVEKAGQYRVAFLVDDDPKYKGKQFFGYPVIGGRESLLAAEQADKLPVIVAIGNNETRMNVAAWLNDRGFASVSAIHPSAQLARGVSVGVGSVVMAAAVINSDTAIGNNVIINTGATVDHDCRIGDGVHIAPGCHLCGGVSVGDCSLIGAGCVLIPGVCVGRHVVLGARSTVIHNIGDGAKAVGSPAKAVCP